MDKTPISKTDTAGKVIQHITKSPQMTIIFAVILMLLGAVAGYRYNIFLTSASANASTMTKISTSEQYAVHISGAVAEPGIYWFDAGARVNDALNEAGILPTTDSESLNLAAYLIDEQKIIVPSLPVSEENMLDATESNSSMDSTAAEDSLTATAQRDNSISGKININTANAAKLQCLPGIGKVKSAAIITYREQNGAFTSIEQITNVSGIGNATLEKIRDQICVE